MSCSMYRPSFEELLVNHLPVATSGCPCFGYVANKLPRNIHNMAVPDATLNPVAFIFVPSRAICTQLFFPEKNHFSRRFFWLAPFEEKSAALLCTENLHTSGSKRAQGNHKIKKCLWFLCPVKYFSPAGRGDLTRMQTLKRHLCSLAGLVRLPSRFQLSPRSHMLCFSRARHHRVQMLSQDGDTLAFLTSQCETRRLWWRF